MLPKPWTKIDIEVRNDYDSRRVAKNAQKLFKANSLNQVFPHSYTYIRETVT